MIKKARSTKSADPPEEEFDDEQIESEDPDEGHTLSNTALVSEFIRMWPREIFDPYENAGQKGSIAQYIPQLDKAGVYVLYRDDVPFYVGKTKGRLRSRLRKHATGVVSLKSYFWNYFSAFIVGKDHVDEVEAILISAMPSVVTNSSTPTLRKVPIKEPVRRLMRDLRRKGSIR